MNFAMTAAQKALLSAVDEAMTAHVFPRETAFLHEPFFSIEAELRRGRQAIQAAGLWTPQLPKEVGGMGLSLRDFALVSERLGQSPLGHYLFGCQAPDAGNLEVLLRHGSAAQKEQFLMPLCRGEVRSCFAMTEPETPGSNPTRLQARAVRDGDHYTLDAHKWFTSSADGAAFAIVMAVTDPAAPVHQRASMFIVPTDHPGYQRVRNIPLFGHAGEGYPSHSETRFTACRIPVSLRLGAEGAGFAIAQERLGPGRIHHCMRWIGICERAFRLMCERATTRMIDEHESLAQKQIVQTWIAESRAAIDAARLLVLRTAERIDVGEQQGKDGYYDAQVDISLIKFHVAGVMHEVVDRALQVHGALGMTSDCVLSYFYSHERGARIYDGPDEVHKLSAAKRILRTFAKRNVT